MNYLKNQESGKQTVIHFPEFHVRFYLETKTCTNENSSWQTEIIRIQ